MNAIFLHEFKSYSQIYHHLPFINQLSILFQIFENQIDTWNVSARFSFFNSRTQILYTVNSLFHFLRKIYRFYFILINKIKVSNWQMSYMYAFEYQYWFNYSLTNLIIIFYREWIVVKQYLIIIINNIIQFLSKNCLMLPIVSTIYKSI